MKILFSFLISLSLLAQTNVTTNAFGTGKVGPAIQILDETGKVGYAVIGNTLTLTKRADGSYILEAAVPLSIFKMRQVSFRVTTPGNTYTLPSLPQTSESVLIARNGATLSLTTDYSINGAVITFVQAQSLLVGDQVVISYIEKAL